MMPVRSPLDVKKCVLVPENCRAFRGCRPESSQGLRGVFSVGPTRIAMRIKDPFQPSGSPKEAPKRECPPMAPQAEVPSLCHHHCGYSSWGMREGIEVEGEDTILLMSR